MITCKMSFLHIELLFMSRQSYHKIQLIGGTKCQIVHDNRLKLCYGHPEPGLQQISRNERNAGHSHSNQPDDASGHVMVEEEEEEEEALALVHGEEEALALVHGEEEALALVHGEEEALALVHGEEEALALVHGEEEALALVHGEEEALALVHGEEEALALVHGEEEALALVHGEEEALALVHGEEEVMIQEGATRTENESGATRTENESGATRTENESGERFGPKVEQIEIPVPQSRDTLNVFETPLSGSKTTMHRHSFTCGDTRN